MKIRARIVKRFKNKYSKKVHKEGDIIEVSKQRLEEINSTKYGKLAEIIEVEPEDPEKSEDDEETKGV